MLSELLFRTHETFALDNEIVCDCEMVSIFNESQIVNREDLIEKFCSGKTQATCSRGKLTMAIIVVLIVLLLLATSGFLIYYYRAAIELKVIRFMWILDFECVKEKDSKVSLIYHYDDDKLVGELKEKMEEHFGIKVLILDFHIGFPEAVQYRNYMKNSHKIAFILTENFMDNKVLLDKLEVAKNDFEYQR